jgi:hypothetical protein
MLTRVLDGSPGQESSGMEKRKALKILGRGVYIIDII